MHGITDTVKVHVAVLLDVSVAVHVTVVVPIANVDPDAGAQFAVAPGQLSVGVGVVYVTVVGELLVTLIFAGQVIDGFWVSFTVTVNVQFPVLPLASVAEQVTVVTPFGNAVPLAGTQFTAPTPGQLSVTAGVANVVIAEHRFGSVLLVMFPGQGPTTGGWLSLTVTVNVHGVVDTFPDASVALQLTVVTPFANVDPLAGVQLAVAPGQLSLAVAVNVTLAVQIPAPVFVVMFEGQVTVGGCASFTVTVNEQLDEPPVLLAVHVTVVVPLLKVLPDAGVHVTVGTGQPDAVGVVKFTTAVHTLLSVFVVMFAGHAPITGGLTRVAVSVLVVTVEKFDPVMLAELLIVQTPFGNGLSTVTWNVMVTLSPGGIVPMALVTVSPLNGARDALPLEFTA